MGSTSERKLAALFLSRATFGPRPGELDRVVASGTERWLDDQLHPERVEDAAVEEELAGYPNLSLSTPELMKKLPRPGPDEMRGAERELFIQLSHAKLVRAISSERQLQEVMSDFWFNHFNVYARKHRNVLLSLPSYERSAIRPHSLGTFSDLLRAVAEHPAMLLYLDNWINTKEGFNPREELRDRLGRRGRRRPDAEEDRRKLGLNENYARELLELHTLGVDGGYSQKDVVEVARAFTGWSVVGPRLIALRDRLAKGSRTRLDVPDEGSFFFVSMAHDSGPKTLLGERLTGTGVEEGLEVLDRLSRHASTARFISTKLAQRFVSDDPPEALVREMANDFLRGGGDIREVVRRMFLSPSFADAAARRDKVKSPLELVVSSMRALSIPKVESSLSRALFDLGMPLYLCQPPTGYDEASSTWLSAGNVLTRTRFALDLAAGRIRGAGKPANPDTALLLSSPEFQRH